MDFVVAAVVGYALLALTYSFLTTEWPDRYYSVSDLVGRRQSVSLRAYLLFRLAPAFGVALLITGLLHQQGRTGWLVWAAALVPVILHAAKTHGRALLRSTTRFGKRREAVYHLLATGGLLLAGALGGWMSTQDFSRPLIPSLVGIADGIWTALLAALLAAVAYRLLQARLEDPYFVVRDTLMSLDSELVAYARSQARTAEVDEGLVVAIMVVESIQRPAWLRRLERVFARLLRRGTYGIMQVRSRSPLSDRESIDAAIQGPLAEVTLARDQSGWADRGSVLAAVSRYNADPVFAEWLVMALEAIRDPDVPL